MKIAVTGISGKMGRVIGSLVIKDEIAELSSGLTRASSGLEGLDLGEFLGFEKNNISNYYKNPIWGSENNLKSVGSLGAMKKYF